MKISTTLVFITAILIIFSGIATYLAKTTMAAIVKNLSGYDVPSSYYTTKYVYGQTIPDKQYARGKELLGQQ